MRIPYATAAVALLAAACSFAATTMDTSPAPVPEVQEGQAAAIFGGGCFWCMEADFDKLDGIVHTTSGYAGGSEQDPTYEQVAMHKTHHVEVVRVVYDTSKLSYDQVVDYFFHHVDPTDAGGQFCDRGDTYRTAVFTLDDAQTKAAEAKKAAIDASGVLPLPIVTEIRQVSEFWPAETYHQDFATKSPGRYQPYRAGCGRDARVKAIWAKDTAAAHE